MDPLETVFRHLDAWRHLPAYQLERRADVFFSVYLRAVVEEFTGVALEAEMIPELPIKRDLVWPERPTNQSVKVDYALFAKDRSRVFFVELKTDGSSRRDDQDHYLEAAKRLRFRAIVDGVCAIVRRTDAHQKYHHLVSALERLGYVEAPADLERFIRPAPSPRRVLDEQLASIVAAPFDPPIEVVYVQPEKTGGDRCVDFATFAAHVDRFADPMSKLFAEHLRRWATTAGVPSPLSHVGG